MSRQLPPIQRLSSSILSVPGNARTHYARPHQTLASRRTPLGPRSPPPNPSLAERTRRRRCLPPAAAFPILSPRTRRRRRQILSTSCLLVDRPAKSALPAASGPRGSLWEFLLGGPSGCGAASPSRTRGSTPPRRALSRFDTFEEGWTLLGGVGERASAAWCCVQAAEFPRAISGGPSVQFLWAGECLDFEPLQSLLATVACCWFGVDARSIVGADTQTRLADECVSQQIFLASVVARFHGWARCSQTLQVYILSFFWHDGACFNCSSVDDMGSCTCRIATACRSRTFDPTFNRFLSGCNLFPTQGLNLFFDLYFLGIIYIGWVYPLHF
jgi:hypothetical protein